MQHCSLSCQVHMWRTGAQMYCNSSLVNWRWLYVTAPLPSHSKAAVMDPSRLLQDLIAVCAILTSCVPSAATTASSPQHSFACRCKLLVDFTSLILRNRQTNRDQAWHWFVAQWKTWALWLLIYVTVGRGLKKTYMGVSHSFRSRANQLINWWDQIYW